MRGIENFYLRKSSDDFQSSLGYQKMFYLVKDVVSGFPNLSNSERAEIRKADGSTYITFPFLVFCIIKWAKRIDKKSF